MMKENDYLCPSAGLTPESFLFGILDENAVVKYIGNPVPMTDELWQNFTKMPSPEKHFRFTMRCHNRECGQWADGKCSVASALKHADAKYTDQPAEACGIKEACRWFSQEGEAACAVCKYIVTDVSSPA